MWPARLTGSPEAAGRTGQLQEHPGNQCFLISEQEEVHLFWLQTRWTTELKQRWCLHFCWNTISSGSFHPSLLADVTHAKLRLQIQLFYVSLQEHMLKWNKWSRRGCEALGETLWCGSIFIHIYTNVSSSRLDVIWTVTRVENQFTLLMEPSEQHEQTHLINWKF